MANKIIFSLSAEKERLSILEYYYKETKSKKIPLKIYTEINNAIDIIQKFPMSGKDLGKKRRGIIKSYYKIIYTIKENEIIILPIWDTRQDPKNIPI